MTFLSASALRSAVTPDCTGSSPSQTGADHTINRLAVRDGAIGVKPILEDVLQPGLVTVFCGSAAGNRSARLGQYYAGPGNRFWHILHEAGFTDRRLEPREYREVVHHGLGLTDLAKFEFGNDDQLSSNAYLCSDLREKIERYRPALLAFVAKKPAQRFIREQFAMPVGNYGLQRVTLGNTRIWVLPSTSARARKYCHEKPWHDLARQHRRIRLGKGS